MLTRISALKRAVADTQTALGRAAALAEAWAMAAEDDTRSVNGHVELADARVAHLERRLVVLRRALRHARRVAAERSSNIVEG